MTTRAQGHEEAGEKEPSISFLTFVIFVPLSEAGGENLFQLSHLNHSLGDSLKNTKNTRRKELREKRSHAGRI
jgi:hypothetical protein